MDKLFTYEQETGAVNPTLHAHGHRHESAPLTGAEVTTVAAICNRLARLRGNVDREGLYRDFEIIQSHCPLDLDALAASSDSVFLAEMTIIAEQTDRTTRSLRGGFHSTFMVGQGKQAPS